MATARRAIAASYTAGNEPTSFSQERDRLLQEFKLLEGVHAVLEKLGYLFMAGPMESRSKLLPKFKKLDTLIEQTDPDATQVQIFEIEAGLLKYERSIEQESDTISPYVLRQHIKQARLEREDLLTMVRYLSASQPDCSDGRDKFELLLTVLCIGTNETERTKLLENLFPVLQPLSPAATKTIERINTLTSQLESIAFIQLIEGGYLSQARSLKLELGKSLWHPEALRAVSLLNLSLKICFTNLLNAERNNIILSCRKLQMAGINSFKFEAGTLSVEVAMRLAERAEELLEGNYYTNIQPLQKFAKIARWMRANSELFVEQNQTEPNTLFVATILETKSDKGSVVEPLCAISRDMNVEEMEEQLKARIKEIARILASRPYYFKCKPVQLSQTVLQLNNLEIQAINSPGNLVESLTRLHQFSHIRRSVALMAELQESTAIYKEESNKRSYFNLPTMTYYLKQARQTMGELEKMILTSRKGNELPIAIDLVDLWNKLEMIFRSGCKIINDLFPMLKLNHLGLSLQ